MLIEKPDCKYKGIFLKLKNKRMTKQSYYLLLFVTLPILSSCEAIETIFQAGMWWAFILIFAVIALVLWIASKAKK